MKKLYYWFLDWIAPIKCLGFISGIRYKLGIAEEGVDFITLPLEED